MVPLKGFEPSAPYFGGMCSIQTELQGQEMALPKGFEPLAYRLGGGRSNPD